MLSPWGSGAVSLSSGPKCGQSGPDLHWPETETKSSNQHGFAFSEKMIERTAISGCETSASARQLFSTVPEFNVQFLKNTS